MVKQRDSSQLVELVRTVLRVRNCLVERERHEGVTTMKGWEVNLARQLLKKGIPGSLGEFIFKYNHEIKYLCLINGSPSLR